MKTREGIKRFYQKNERRTLQRLGFKPAAGSGNGWIEKEDGENDRYICQLKSTDADSYRIHKLDLDKLIYHASVSHKIPVFIIQFLTDGEMLALVRLNDLDSLSQTSKKQPLVVIKESTIETNSTQKIKSSKKARQNFYERREKEWQK